MYIAPESKVLCALANVAATSVTEPIVVNISTTTVDEFEE